MQYRLVKLMLPGKTPHYPPLMIPAYRIPLTQKNMSIYDTVDFFRQEIFPDKSKLREQNKTPSAQVTLREIINLHNTDGIRDISQVRSMVQQVQSGKDILSRSGMPNIKLVRSRRREWVLFDGHHSLLAYMACGKKKLGELPHLIVQNRTGYVKDREILAFYGKHSGKMRARDWRRYVINWQLEGEQQLCPRVQENMGALLDSLRNRARNSLAMR